MTTPEFNLVGQAEPIIVATDIGGTTTRLWVDEGERHISTAYRTPHDYPTMLTNMNANILRLTEGRSPQVIGAAVAGKLDSDRLGMVSAGALQEYGWVGKPLSLDLAAAFSIEPDSVALLNDVEAAAVGQQERAEQDGVDMGYIVTISTGFGGAAFYDGVVIPDEPGHQFLRPGAICGCGKEGCAEAHISGSGIARKFNMRAEDLPPELWREVGHDAVEAHVQLLQRVTESVGRAPQDLYFYGSVALRSKTLLRDIVTGLTGRRDELPQRPFIRRAYKEDNIGLYGAQLTARALLAR